MKCRDLGHSVLSKVFSLGGREGGRGSHFFYVAPSATCSSGARWLFCEI